MPNSDKEAWLRKQALMIAGQLPDNTDDAVTVLDYAREYATMIPSGSQSRRVHSLRIVESGGAEGDSDVGVDRPAVR